MPKMRTRKAAAKRFKKTARGQYKRAQSGNDHLRSKKTSARRRRLRRTTLVSPNDHKRLKKILG
ncbi:MAG: 50S ribosomal protein L35 [Bacillota bacterium]